jgi:hypothetical protein
VQLFSGEALTPPPAAASAAAGEQAQQQSRASPAAQTILSAISGGSKATLPQQQSQVRNRLWGFAVTDVTLGHLQHLGKAQKHPAILCV